MLLNAVGRVPTVHLSSFIHKKISKSISRSTNGSDDQEHHHEYVKRSVPLIASPLDPKATAWLEKKHETGNLTLKRRPTIAQFEANRFAGGIFRKQHEASTLELFFDLFFVANLAVFTSNHEHVSPQSVGNYVGFFTLLWFTWFQISIFDVRFYVDSLFNRFCKIVTFGIFVSFTSFGPVYDAITYGDESKSFHAMALVLMVSRLLLLLQHATVLWFIRPFRKTVLPMSLMMLIYLLSAMAFLGTFLNDDGSNVAAKKGSIHVYIWYGVVGAEALAVIVVSSIWRILSFKHTHLVERVGLLTLIIMGEGIIGLTKSVSYLLAGSNISIWTVIGEVVAAVMLIYEIYILYFSPIDHDRFGTIRMQFWTLMHFPLHVAILLTEEGSAVSLLWNAVMDARDWLRGALPNMELPSKGFTSADGWITSVNDTLSLTAERYHYVKLKDVFDWNTELVEVRNISEEFGSEGWNEQASEILKGIFTETTNFLFENYNFEMSKTTEAEPDPEKKLQAAIEAYRTVYQFFFAAAGAILLIFASMYFISKRGKTREEYAAIATRVVAGACLPIAIVAAHTSRFDTGFIYEQSGWVIPIVTFALLFVVLLDNYINSWVDKRRIDDAEDGASSAEKGHRHGALHGAYVDAHASAMHFRKPSSFVDSHKHSSNEHHHGEDESHPFMTAPSESLMPPTHTYDQHGFVPGPSYSEPEHNNNSNNTHTRNLSAQNTSYTPFHIPFPHNNSNNTTTNSSSNSSSRLQQTSTTTSNITTTKSHDSNTSDTAPLVHHSSGSGSISGGGNSGGGVSKSMSQQ